MGSHCNHKIQPPINTAIECILSLHHSYKFTGLFTPLICEIFTFIFKTYYPSIITCQFVILSCYYYRLLLNRIFIICYGLWWKVLTCIGISLLSMTCNRCGGRIGGPWWCMPWPELRGGISCVYSPGGEPTQNIISHSLTYII